MGPSPTPHRPATWRHEDGGPHRAGRHDGNDGRRARLALPEASIARLSADGGDVYVVGDTSLLRVRVSIA